MSEFIWVGLPYIAFTFLVIGSIVRYTVSERTWTTKSSEFLEKKQLKIAGPLFHGALFFVFLGHVGGVLVPQEVTEFFGVSEHQYHAMALYIGGLAGIALVVGFFLLMRRRFFSRYMKVNTSTMLNADGAFNYREYIGPWFRSLLYWHPQPALMEHIPVIFKVHMLSWMIVCIIFPFTRLVHCLSIPFNYLRRSPVVYRKR